MTGKSDPEPYRIPPLSKTHNNSTILFKNAHFSENGVQACKHFHKIIEILYKLMLDPDPKCPVKSDKKIFLT